MRLKTKGLLYIFGCCLVIFNGSTFAADPGYLEVIGGVGGAQLNTGNSELGVTRSETDALIQTNRNDWNAVAGQFGLGYVYFIADALRYSDQVQWVPSLEPELNIEQISGNNIQGNVWRYNSSAFNDLTYSMPLGSTRLMVDAALTVMSYKHVSVYAIGGIGSAWNRLGYSDNDNSGSGSGEASGPCPDQRLNLHSTTSRSFAWEGGAGVTYAINDRFGLSVEYQYVNLGKARTSGSGETGTITIPLIAAAQFNNLASQTALVALHITL